MTLFLAQICGLFWFHTFTPFISLTMAGLVTLGAWRWAKLSGGHTLTPIACLCRKHEKCLLSATNSIRHFPVTWPAKDSKRKMWPKIKFRINVTPPLRPRREMGGCTLRESSFHVRNENTCCIITETEGDKISTHHFTAHALRCEFLQLHSI